jgi:hypothetical protein
MFWRFSTGAEAGLTPRGFILSGMAHTLRKFADEYQLEANGVKFWTPYWINSDEAPFHLEAPYAGKATPQELRDQLVKQMEEWPVDVHEHDAEAWRGRFRELGLGVDCSGFVYYVMSQWLKLREIELADLLVLERSEVLAYLERHPKLKPEWGPDEIPEVVPLGYACRRWRVNPARIINVLRLTDQRVVTPIHRAGEAQPGDFVHMSHDSSDHIGVVLDTAPNTITYADSAHEPPTFGGVKIRHIQVTAPDKGLEYQVWEQKRIFHPDEPGSRDGIWRLRVLTEAAQ